MDNSNLPKHIAIIMDGNGRWAKERGLPRVRGHQAGIESIRDIVRYAGEIGVSYLTLYAFSTENWARPKEEIHFLMQLLSRYLDIEFEEIKKNGVRLKVIGHIQDLPEEIRDKLARNIEATRENQRLTLTLALSYSGRTEIADACRAIAELCLKGEIHPADVTQEMISHHLETRDLPDPDLLIRTSGEMRISNFLLWQLSYTEIYVTHKYWPDFRRQDLEEAIEDYRRRERRFGRTKSSSAIS